MWRLRLRRRRSGQTDAPISDPSAVLASRARGGDVMQLEHRIVSVHGRDGVGILLGPGGAVFLREIHQTFVHALLLSVFRATGSGGSDSGEPYRAVRD